MRIAIVDDLETERSQLKTRLSRQLNLCGAKAEILEFESGESFLAAEKEQRFTAAFLDIYMHGMSGMRDLQVHHYNRSNSQDSGLLRLPHL